ncbi:MAG: serine hydrolase, partial [Planctomycetota bacterium]|nr:serine hydrolase [Planctomycetota bacterium]
MTHRITATLLATLLISCLPLSAQELPSARPEAVGLSSEKLGKVDKIVDGLIASNRLAGATVIILRHGKVAYFKAFGQMDRERK